MLSPKNLVFQQFFALIYILISTSDRCTVQDREKIETIQEKLIFCLQYLLNVRHGGPGKLFYKTFDFLTELRDLSEKEHEVTKHLMSEPLMSTKINSCALMREFLT